MSLTIRAIDATPFRRDEMPRYREPDGDLPLDAYLDRLHPCSVRRHYPRNAAIFFEGDAAENLYRVVDGVIRLCKHKDDGRRHVVDFVLAGEVFAYTLAPCHSFTAEAVNDVVLIAYPRQKLENLGQANPALAKRLLTHLSGNILSMQQQLVLLGCHDATEKLASFLLRLAHRSAMDERLTLAMGRQDIADHLGLTVETICRTLRALKRNGVIDIPCAQELVLINAHALHAIAYS